MIQETFIGTREFKQVFENSICRVYEVTTTGGSTHFEIFRKKFNNFGEEIYPNQNDFGVTANTTLTFEKALEKVDFWSSYNVDNQSIIKLKND